METLGQRQVRADHVGHMREEKVVKVLEPTGETDGLAERHIGLNEEMLGDDLPGVVPFGAQPVGLDSGQPAGLVLHSSAGGGQLASVKMRHPVGRYPAEDRMVNDTLLELASREG